MATWKGTVNKKFLPDELKTYVESLSFSNWRPSFVVLHNTGAPTFAQWHDVPGETRMQNLESYYRDQQGWSAGPHLFIADDYIWAFTPLTVPGVHSPSWNSVSWGVELVGDYSKEELGAKLRSNAISALATLHGSLGLMPCTLRLHREDPETTHICPGNMVSKSDFISLVTAELGTMFAGEHPDMRVA